MSRNFPPGICPLDICRHIKHLSLDRVRVGKPKDRVTVRIIGLGIVLEVRVRDRVRVNLRYQ